MSMSRKHYIAIADNFCDHFDSLSQPYTKQQLAEMLASCLRGTNPRFDRGRFVRRCMQGCSDSEYAKRQRRLNQLNRELA